MEKTNFPRTVKAYLPLIALFLIMVFVMPRSPKFNYDYKKGSPWLYETLIAQFDFPILKTDEQIQAEQEKNGSVVIPYFRLDAKVAAHSGKALSSIDLGEWSVVKPALADAMAAVYAKGIVSSVNELDTDSGEGLIFVQKDRRASKVPVSEVYAQEDAEAYLRDVIVRSWPECNVDSLFTAAGIGSLVEPNLIYDAQTTELVHDESVKYVSNTQGVVKVGQVIVSEGEIVTAEIEQLLKSYEQEYDKSVGYVGSRGFMWVGNVILAFSLVLMLFLALCYCNFRVFDEYNKYLYLLMIFAVAAIASSLVAREDPSMYY